MKVAELITRLKLICANANVSTSQVDVLFREDYDADECDVNFAHEDLYDEQTNNILTSVMLLRCDKEI